MKLEGRVVDLSSKGWGVTKTADGLTCFVPGAWPGDEIIFELLREEKFRLGRLLEWKKRSDAHRPSACPHFGFEPGQCGGCPWMGIHYEEQLKAKENKLSSVLRHFHVEPQIRHPIVASPLEFH